MQQALILVPGLASDAACWAHQVKHLSDIADVAAVEVNACASRDEMAEAILAAAPNQFALAGKWVTASSVHHDDIMDRPLPLHASIAVKWTTRLFCGYRIFATHSRKVTYRIRAYGFGGPSIPSFEWRTSSCLKKKPVNSIAHR